MAFGDSLAEALREISELKRVVANMMRIGTVHAIDPAKGTVRLKYGEANGQPILGPEIPWMEQGGALKSWKPPAVDQLMISFNPVGDQRQGMALNAAFSNQNAAPSSKGDENVLTFGPWRITLDGGKLKVVGPTVEVTGDVKVTGNVDFSGGYVKSNGKRIDDTHKHVGVQPGGGQTGTPA